MSKKLPYRDPNSPSGYIEGVSEKWPEEDRKRRTPQPDGSQLKKKRGELVDPVLVQQSNERD